jgi:hypothetical protein
LPSEAVVAGTGVAERIPAKVLIKFAGSQVAVGVADGVGLIEKVVV